MCTVTYLTIRPASFTCWPLLAWPFLSSILLYFPIDFLFADFVYKLLTAGGEQNRSAPVQDVADAVTVHWKKVAVDEPVPAPADAHALNALPSAVRTTARTAAFMPGASPPLVRMPIRFTIFAMVLSSLRSPSSSRSFHYVMSRPRCQASVPPLPATRAHIH